MMNPAPPELCYMVNILIPDRCFLVLVKKRMRYSVDKGGAG
jgi:hypothetical protein